MKENEQNIGVVYRGEAGWRHFQNQLAQLAPTSIFILTDSNTKHHCLPYFLEKAALKTNYAVLEMAAGEAHKTIHTCIDLWNELSEKNGDRKSLLINLGGGVVTDLGAFVACTFKRGISIINIPTSLLAMVDASIGGKNGIDLGPIKNQIGIIKNPETVIIDTRFLSSLPEEEVRSGLAEMLKHGLIANEDYWKRCQAFEFSSEEDAEKLIWESIAIKNDIVAQDPTEKGLRKALNYGHTLGHAIESYFLDIPEKQTLLHGEAVAVGMVLATYISRELFGFPENQLNNITEALLGTYGRVSFSQEDIGRIIDLLKFDKKNLNGKVLFVLLADFGKPQFDCEVPNSLIINAFEYYENFR
ncbi:MAG: 3-dehydroquinate synthase [Flavobacteriaceae bacterium]|nr:3-dehydroquinate synthase [Flavobacteriaceae bacterium]